MRKQGALSMKGVLLGSLETLNPSKMKVLVPAVDAWLKDPTGKVSSGETLSTALVNLGLVDQGI